MNSDNTAASMTDSREEVMLRLNEADDFIGAFVMFCRRNGFSEIQAEAESLYIHVNQKGYDLKCLADAMLKERAK